ncbi:MAG: alpha/beta hydrolase [Kiritimatiellae bacterium]|nr:alpha/beta hydrolase [Kiritimatiellia bacterium]
MKITQHTIRHNISSLYAMLYEPSVETEASIVFCNPLFEERKSANRTMTEHATFLCSKGFQVLTFDYSGSGDSSGNFEDFSMNDWLSDIATACSFLKSQSHNTPLGLFGLRFGGSLALQYTSELPPCDFVIAWEAIINGEDYVEQELRKKLMKEMITFNKNHGTRTTLLEQLHNGESIDLDGYALTPEIYNDLCRIDLTNASPPENPSLFLHISHTNDPAKRVTSLNNSWSSMKNIEFSTIQMQPFWNLIGHVDCATAIESTYEWLTKILTINNKQIH